MSVVTKKNIKVILNKSNFSVLDTSLNFKIGDVIRVNYIPPFSLSEGKERPVIIFNTPEETNSSVFSCIPITSNPNITDSIPILLNGKISFINTLEEYSIRKKTIFENSDVVSLNVIAGIPEYILDMVRYIKIRRISNFYDDEFENAIDKYIRYIYQLITTGVYPLYRNIENIMDKSSHTIFDYVRDSEPTYSDVSENVDLLNHLYDSNKSEIKETSNKIIPLKSDSTIDILESDSSETICEKLKSNFTKDKFYFINGDGKLKIYPIRMLNLSNKSEMLMIFSQIGSVAKIIEVFEISRTSIKTYMHSIYKELSELSRKESIDIPEIITEFISKYK